MAEVQEKESGKKKKGAQKKMTIRVDFTPMVDMNMLLITFFMLCTTMIKSQTLRISLPSNDKNIQEESKNEAKESQAVTLILDTEYDAQGNIAHDENGKTKHIVYYYFGKDSVPVYADQPNGPRKVNEIKSTVYMGDTKNGSSRVHNGIRAVLRERNSEVMDVYDNLKADYKAKKITREEFMEQAKKNAADTLNTDGSKRTKLPVVVIKPGPNLTYEGLINALDEMNISQIARYTIQSPTKADTVLLKNYWIANGEDTIRPLVRKGSIN